MNSAFLIHNSAFPYILYSMKKFVAIFCFLPIFALFACSDGDLKKYAGSISELRDRVFCAEDDSYAVTAVSGVRESPYETDGVSGDKCDFTVVTVVPTSFAAGSVYTYCAVIGNETLRGELLPHPFLPQLSIDLPVRASGDFAFSVSHEGGERAYTLADAVTGECISAEKAFSIALEKLREPLGRFKHKNKLQAEIYVRLTKNTTVASGGDYFWFVSFASATDSVAVLLHCNTGAVAAIRT